MDGPSSEPDGRPAEIAVRSWACLAGGLAGTTLAAAFGAENVMNIIAGGAVAPVSTAALYIGLAGVVYLSYCSIAQELTPLVRYYLRTRARE